jgi:hypothetical protein
VGGLRAPAARSRLQAELRGIRGRVVNVSFRRMRFLITARQAGLTTDVNGAVEAAVQASRGGWFVGRTLSGLFDDHVDAQVAMPVTYNHQAVDDFVARVQHAIDRPPRDASVSVDGSGHLVNVASAPGTTVDAVTLTSALQSASRRRTSRSRCSPPAIRRTSLSTGPTSSCSSTST